MEEESRRARRWKLIKSLRVLEQDTDVFIGHLLDVTTEGMMLASRNPMPVGKIFHLWIELMSEQMMVKAECRWSRKDLNSDTYKNGFWFVNLDSKTMENIRCLIEALKFQADSSN